ncbi:unnamed protein product [Parnassius apollo]|uniref:Hemolin n=1 Tax=Parnassius apollo TaxID=110799 RepID=A0A8S3X0F5_PARAO|nr:unnamed protein product [Parnassius apollo]
MKLIYLNNIFIIKWEGVWLNITAAHRDMNGALLCIASNGVPPSVSKRILLHVLCKPRAKVIQKTITFSAGDAAVLQCHIEAYPSPNIYWTDMYINRIKNDSKHETKTISYGYEHTSRLKINNVSRDDTGPYQCHAENLLGSGNDRVTLYMLATTTAFDSSTVQIMAPSSSETTTPMNSSNADFETVITEEYSGSDAFGVILSQHQMQKQGIVSTS